MRLKISDLKINYILKGTGRQTILMIHGWGGSIHSWQPLLNVLTQKIDLSKIKILILDLPGFGESQEPPSTWGIKDYANFLLSIIKKFKIRKNNLILIGHSFGGQIACYFTIINPEYINKLILIDPACIRKSGLLAKIAKNIHGKLKQKLKMAISFIPFLKKLLTKLLGNYDYMKASGRMKKIMQRVIDEDLTEILPQIASKTIIIWGEKDSITKPTEGIIIKNLIKNARLFFIKDARHSPHLTKPNLVARLILDFINEP